MTLRLGLPPPEWFSSYTSVVLWSNVIRVFVARAHAIRISSRGSMCTFANNEEKIRARILKFAAAKKLGKTPKAAEQIYFYLHGKS